jgi:DHA1 family tetracycline resistance protein-like MFS transporter
MPVLPFWAKEFEATGLMLGGVLSIYAAAQFVFAPLWGRLSDRIGRRPVMLMTIAGTAASLVLLGFSTSIAGLFLARALAGAFAANISVATAYVTDVTAEEERTRWMGMIGASFAVGFLLGPAIGGLLGVYGYHVPMLTAAALATVNLVVAFFTLVEPPARVQPERTAGRLEVLRDPAVRRLSIANLLFALGVTQLESMFAFLMMDRFGWDVREVAFVLVGMAVVMGGIQGGGMKALAARYPERTLVIAGAAMLAVAFAGIPLAGSVAILLVPLTLSAVGRGISQPSLMSLASFQSDASNRGSVMGTFQSSASLARVFGPAIAGLLYDQDVGGPFWLAAGLMGAVVVLSMRFPEGSTRTQETVAST